MEIADILRIITTDGLAILIAALVLYFAVKFGNVWFKEFEIKRGIKSHDELADTRRHVGSIIQKILDRVVLLTRADRVYVFEFHNGQVSMGGLPFLKMTNTYEALGEGARSEVRRRDNMSLQLYSSFVDAICAKDYITLDPENRSEEYSRLVYETLIEHKVNQTVRAKITDVNRRVIGYIGIDYCDTVADERLEECKKIIQETAREVGTLLSVGTKLRKE